MYSSAIHTFQIVIVIDCFTWNSQLNWINNFSTSPNKACGNSGLLTGSSQQPLTLCMYLATVERNKFLAGRDLQKHQPHILHPSAAVYWGFERTEHMEEKETKNTKEPSGVALYHKEKIHRVISNSSWFLWLNWVKKRNTIDKLCSSCIFHGMENRVDYQQHHLQWLFQKRDNVAASVSGSVYL